MQTLSSRIVYRNRWMSVREDQIRREDGSEGIYGVVDKPEATIVIPVQDDRVHLVEQFKYPAGARYWEFPQGAWEGKSDYTPEELARGELLEETGLHATQLIHLARIFVAYGALSQPIRVWAATGLTQHDAQPEPEEQGIVHASFTWAEFHQMVASGRIADSMTLAAYSLLRMQHPELAGE
jgi:8-oxo-dGTP pyrophosphatase MutT (NUDIX family)